MRAALLELGLLSISLAVFESLPESDDLGHVDSADLLGYSQSGTDDLLSGNGLTGKQRCGESGDKNYASRKLIERQQKAGFVKDPAAAWSRARIVVLWR